ncbi:hypothetical protein LC612_42555 [Nostoc sp. CHAB 5834]|nr:hypothetical protein [Nostoc sp. CHAB 5834]
MKSMPLPFNLPVTSPSWTHFYLDTVKQLPPDADSFMAFGFLPNSDVGNMNPQNFPVQLDDLKLIVFDELIENLLTKDQLDTLTSQKLDDELLTKLKKILASKIYK